MKATAVYNAPAEGTVTLTITETDARKLRAVVGHTTGEHFDGIYKALHSLKLKPMSLRRCDGDYPRFDLHNDFIFEG